MLDKVEFTTKSGQKLTIPFYDGAEGFFIQSIEGIDPVDVVIVSSSFANVDGEQYQSARRGSRNLVFKMGVDVSQVHGSVTQLRRNLMSLLMPKAETTLRFFSDDFPAVNIVGIVESFDWPLFVQEPEVTLSIICHASDFAEMASVLMTDTTKTQIVNAATSYLGTIETGFKFRMLVDRPLDGFTIFHRSATDVLSSLEFEEPLIAGDLVEICTISGEKEIALTRANTRSLILHAMSPYSNWINLFPGANYISVVTPGEEIEYTIEYVNKYGGL